MECQQAKHKGKAEIRIWHGNQNLKKDFQETLLFSPTFITTLDHMYENNSYKTNTMVTI